jgi:cell division initiation protein
MKITPLDIRQKTFEKQLRGYDKEEVNAFLVYLSQEWEKLSEERNTLLIRLEHAEKEASKLREVEASLFKTLKTAEDTGASIIEQANKTADIILKEAQINADTLESTSKNRAKTMVENAESQASEIMGELKDQVRQLSNSYEKLLEQRASILQDLKTLAREADEARENAENQFKKVDITVHENLVKELEKKPTAPPSYTFDVPKRPKEQPPEDVSDTLPPEEPSQGPPSAQEPVEEKEEEKPASGRKSSGSFFDQFD